MDTDFITSIISASTALIAVLIGPFITIRASKNQMLGPMRQAWINTLRDTISEFLSLISISRFLVVASNKAPEEVRRTQEYEDRNRLQLAYHLKEKISLLINPKEEDHNELVRLLESAYDTYHNGKDTTNIMQAIRNQTQSILKREWEVIKK